MKIIIPIVIFYGVFIALEWPLLRSGKRGRAFYCSLLLLNLVISIAAAQGLRLPSPTPLFEAIIRAMPFSELQVLP